ILLTDFFQFIISMVGAIGAAIILVNLPEVGGVSQLLDLPDVSKKLNLLPRINQTDAFVALFILPLAVQWWSVWYPGAEPGGGGYIAQRMLAAKSERGALKATLLFNVAHYALRPWPWIIVALVSIVVFPDLESMQNAFPHIDEKLIKNDLAYPAMLSKLPSGLLGLVIASLIAAFMSTVSTQLNWGSSYLVNDFYKRFIKTDASEKELVRMGRVFTVILMFLAALMALMLENALQAFNIVLQIGAGTGLIFILRWFWWRINAYSELSAMIISFFVAIYFQFIHKLTGLPEVTTSIQLLWGVGITTFIWISVTFLTKAEDVAVLSNFYSKIKPGGPGWKKFTKVHFPAEETRGKWDVPTGLICMVLGCFVVYATLFTTGFFIYGEYLYSTIFCSFALVSGYFLVKFMKKIKLD
ncbi:MAG: hypothetical protein K8R53_09020, partial [Bacteroidales bacterium]|nr:hypothetical protein [Bacteroidales bacterium]